MDLGKKIRQLRFKAGLTQEQLANQLGIAPQSVSKWENAVAMPDITMLPLLAEIFGVSIDDMFDLTLEQRFNRIENRLNLEDTLPEDVFLEYEEFLKAQIEGNESQKRAIELLAYLYWHRMEQNARKASCFARDAVRLSPGEKGCQWILNKAEGHAVWDWNVANHTSAIDFYRSLIDEAPNERMPYLYLLDNLIADHRAEEAEHYLTCLCALENSDPILSEVYRAHIALARFDAHKADEIIEELVSAHSDSFVCLFEAAQYYAAKCDYEKAITLYERSFEKDIHKPRFTDTLQGIMDIHVIRRDYQKAADTCSRIIALLENEWGITESAELKKLNEKKARLLAKA